MSVAERGLGFDHPFRTADVNDQHIQSFAALIAVTTDWVITHISANISEFLDIDASVLGHTLDQVLLDEAVHEIRGVLNANAGQGGLGRVRGCDLRHGFPQFDLTIHENKMGFVIEIERGEQPSKVDDIGLVRGLVARVKKANTVEDAAAKAARSIRALTGFDRIAVCRVHGDGSGKVLSEACLPGMLSLLENDFSAEDLAASGAVFDRAQQQLVADVDAAPVSLVSLQDESPLDLRQAVSLAPASLSLAFLRAHDAKAALSIPIIQNGTLAGVVLCHHAKPLRAGFRMRMVIDLFVDLFAYELARVSQTSS